jgi:hypothetical protein
VKNTFDFTLVNPAKNMGGDRYETQFNGTKWTVYFPQKFSRQSGRPAHDITMVLHVGGINPEDFEHDETT